MFKVCSPVFRSLLEPGSPSRQSIVPKRIWAMANHKGAESLVQAADWKFDLLGGPLVAAPWERQVEGTPVIVTIKEEVTARPSLPPIYYDDFLKSR